MIRTSAPPSGELTSVVCAPSIAWYAGVRNLSRAGRLTHSWMPWKVPHFPPIRLGSFDMKDPGPGRHPLGGAVMDEPAAAV